jgi:tetratricopeptide (TPR) repeat protein
MDAHYGLGNVFFPDRPKEAVAEYREAIRINKDYPEAHNNLGNALAIQGKLDEAIAEYREALRLNKDLFQAHQNLGRALLEKGKLNEAVAETREALRLAKDNPEALEQLHEIEQLVQLDTRLPAVLQGKDRPKDPSECLAFARLCRLPHREQHAAAVRFYVEAFAAEPKLVDDLEATHRYNAACSAALAGCGQGGDAAALDGKERARLRQQALDWLRADLEGWNRVLNKEPIKAALVAGTLQHWQEDTDFAGVRSPQALAKQPEAERQAWQKLWDDVAALLARAQEKASAEKKPS